jgi:chromosome segregation ATPase
MITTRTRFASIGGIALISIATLALVPWKLTAQDADAEAVAKLREENAKLRQELEAVRRDAERMRSDVERMRNPAVAERQRETALQREAALQREMTERNTQLVRDHARQVERQQRDMAKVRADLEELRARFTDEHPVVRERQAQLETLEAEMAAAKSDPRVNLKPSGRTKTALVPASERAMKRHEEQRALLQKEIELAERHVEFVRNALENGKEIPASLLAAQRELWDAKLQQARLGGSKADERAVLMQQLNATERLLKEQRKRVEVGTLGLGAEIPFEREVLRIKRQLASPELEN